MHRACTIALLLLLVVAPAQATIFFDDSFEGVSPEASGWSYASGWCAPAGTVTHPCFELDQSTAEAHSGSKSMRGVFNAAWFDPNPQTHEQAMSHSIPATQDVWTRRWEKPVGFFPTTASGTKVLYYKNTAGRVPAPVSVYLFGGVHFPGTVGSRELSIVMQGLKTTCPPGSGAGAGATQEYQTCNYYPNMAAVPVNNDQWYCIIEHINYGTPGVANGSLEIFINGTQTLGYYGQMFLGATDQPSIGSINGPSSMIDVIQLYKQGGKGVGAANGFIYWDQLASGNEPLTCDGSQPPPASDTTQPTAPSGTSNTGQTASSLTFSLTAGIDSVSQVLLLNTERCTVTAGTTCSGFSSLAQTGVTGGSVVSYVSAPLSSATRYCFRWSMQDEAGNISVYTAVTCATTLPASVTTTRNTLATIPFTLSNEDPLSNGSTFDGGYTGFGNLKVVTNAVQSSLLGTPGLMTYNGSTGLGDSWCQFKVANFLGSVVTEQGCLLHAADPPTPTFILCKALLNSANKTEIDRYTNGGKSVLGAEAAITWANGDVGRCEQQGAAISLYRNDVLVLSGTDATLTSGRTGLYAYTESGGSGGSITFDSASSTQNTSNTISLNHTVGAVSNPALFACLYLRNASTAQTVSSITRNGEALTLVKQETALFSGTGDTRVSLYALANPTVGTYPINVTLSGTPYWYTSLMSVSLGGINQTTPAEASNSTDSDAQGTSGSTISHNLTTLTNNAMAVDCALGQADGLLTPNGSQTSRGSLTLGTAVDGAGMSTKPTTTAGSTPLSWTQVASGSHWIHVSGSAKPAGGPAGDLTQNVIDTLVLGDWAATPQPIVIDAVCNASPAVGCTLTYDVTTPTFVRVLTGSNLGTPATTDIVYPIASIPASRYTPPGSIWPTGFNFICFIGQDANHTESTNPNDKICRNITNLTQSDTTPPVLTVGAPNGQTITTTSAVLAITSDKFSTVRYGTVDVSYEDLNLGQLTTVDGVHHSATVNGLSNGPHTFYFCGRDTATPVPNACAIRSMMTFTVNTGGADTTPPTAPSSFSCSPISSSQAPCTFEPSTDAVGVTGYRATIGISDGTNCTPNLIIDSAWSTSTTQMLTGLQPSTTYCVINQGFDAAGNVSPASNVATFTTLGQVNPIPPDKVLNVRLIPGTLKWNELGIQWEASTTSVVQAYQVFRCQVGYSCPNYGLRAIVPALSFTDGAVLPDTTYRYLLYGSGQAGVSTTPSDALDVRTPKIPAGSTLGVCPCEGVNQ